MKELLQNIPAVLRRQVIFRLACSALGTGMVLLTLISGGSLHELIPGTVIAIAFLTGAVSLLGRCADGRYIVIEGECVHIEYTGLRRRPKAVHIKYIGKSVRIIGHLHTLRGLKIGERLQVYLADSAPIYEHDGLYQITSILAIRKVW